MRATEELIRKLPKVELHVHLEGSVLPRTLREFAAQDRVTVPDLQASDWSSFLRLWKSVCALLRKPERFRRIVVDLGRQAYQQGIVYSEVFFSPEPHTRHHGFSFDDLFEALEEGRQEVRRRWNVELRWIADGVRDSSTGVRACARTVEWMLSLRERGGLVGLGLGGNERHGPPQLFSALFAAAGSAGYRLVAHAGEEVDNVLHTLDHLQVSRIGHGTRAFRQPAVLERLRRDRVALEVCPTSNLRLGNLADLSPLRDVLKSGVQIAINSDDPGLFGTDLCRELSLVKEALALEPECLVVLIRDAIEVSFAEESAKTGWRLRIEELLAEPGQPL